MSWYVGKDGRKVWVEHHELVYTVGEVDGELPSETLTYLSMNSQKAIYAEHIIDEDAGGSKKGKKKEKNAGRQRGYVVRVEQDDRARIIPGFRAAADKLLSSGVISRLDVDDSLSTSKKKRGAKEEEPERPSLLQSLAANECRVETSSRCQHNAHGVGFSVDIAENGAQQRIHAFTANRQLPAGDWHEHLVAAIESTGARVMLGRLAGADADAPPPAGAAAAGRGGRGAGGAARDGVREAEDAWLDSVLGRCMVGKASEREVGTKATSAGADAEPGDEAAAGEAGEGDGAGADGEGSAKAAAHKKPAAQLPPWLRRRA
mmetsp:Transcript_148890/g.414854  ORF Transcript_148890/g.414854 Transcript_148890/m.414854 type:complete len:318 (-) Transcript_148890:231-1184(-)